MHADQDLRLISNIGCAQEKLNLRGTISSINVGKVDPLHVLVLVSAEIINTITLSFRSDLSTKTLYWPLEDPYSASYPSDQSLPSAAGFFCTLQGLLSNQITHHSNLKSTESARLHPGFSQDLDQTTTLAAKPVWCIWQSGRDFWVVFSREERFNGSFQRDLFLTPPSKMLTTV